MKKGTASVCGSPKISGQGTFRAMRHRSSAGRKSNSNGNRLYVCLPPLGNGYAQEAAQACLDYGFNDRQFGTIAALIDPNNKASIRVAEKIGMIYDRTIRKWNKPIAVYERKSYN